MNRYYFCIRYLPELVDECLLSGRCIYVLHGFITKRQYSGIGVSFPDWSIASLGKSIAFVSQDKHVLELLSSQSYFQMMESDKVFSISPVIKVPDICSEVRFKRNQNIAKCFVGEKKRRLARAKRRAEARGEEFKPILSSAIREIEPFHNAAVYSKSSNTTLMLHIQKQNNVNRVNNDFGYYGLATNKNYLGTVPELFNPLFIG